MKRGLLPLLCLLSSCALFQKPPRPVHASPEEAAAVEIPLALPLEGRRVAGGVMLRAMNLAMEDYLPWDQKIPAEASPLQQCLHRRESYEVAAVPGPEGIVFVTIIPDANACDIADPPVLDVGATYAIDVRGWRILSIQQ
jgi:hypothetical protein